MPTEPAASLEPSSRGMSSRRIMVVIFAALWLLLVALPPAGLAIVRESWMRQLDRPQARADWDAFRGAMRAQTGRDGPVQRKVPRSDEPPGLVWLRDHFVLACSAWLLFGSVLWGMTAFFAIGVGSGRRPATCRSPAEDQSRRDRHHEKEDDGDAEDAKQG